MPNVMRPRSRRTFELKIERAVNHINKTIAALAPDFYAEIKLGTMTEAEVDAVVGPEGMLRAVQGGLQALVVPKETAEEPKPEPEPAGV